ncbi:MAG: hemerythrin family protein [Alphaproteobacteria bacterium]|nr:hemerythrin family protein [Alphaproteobacteria bacterium]
MMAFFNSMFGNIRPRIYSVLNEDQTELCDLITELCDMAKQRCKTDDERAERYRACLELVDRLVAETEAYFEREEGLMKNYDYPLAREHAMDHLVLLRTIENYQLTLRHDPTAVTTEAVAYFSDWLTRHIGTADKHLETFLSGYIDKRTVQRRDLSAISRCSLSRLFSLSDTVSPEVAAANRSNHNHYEGRKEDVRLSYDADRRFQNADAEQRRLQDRIWYE